MRNVRPLRRETHQIDGDSVTVRELSAGEMQSYLLHLRRLGGGEQLATDLLMLFACYGEDREPWLCSREALEPPTKPGPITSESPARIDGVLRADLIHPIDAALEQFNDQDEGLPGPAYMQLIGIVNRVNNGETAPPKN